MSKIKPISIETFNDLVENNFTIAVYCLPCDRWHDVDIPKLIEQDYGSKTYVGAKFKCKKCGEVADMQVRPGATWPKGSSPFTTLTT